MDRDEACEIIMSYDLKVKYKVASWLGDKNSKMCPACGKSSYVFYGRWKQCNSCGYHNTLHKQVVALRSAFRKGRDTVYRDGTVVVFAEYVLDTQKLKRSD